MTGQQDFEVDRKRLDDLEESKRAINN